MSDLLSGDTFVIELKQFLTDDQWVNVIEFDGEEHLTVSLQSFEHLGVAVLEHAKNLFNHFEDLVFRDGWVHPLSQVVEQLFLVVLAVLFSTEVLVDGGHS